MSLVPYQVTDEFTFFERYSDDGNIIQVIGFFMPTPGKVVVIKIDVSGGHQTEDDRVNDRTTNSSQVHPAVETRKQEDNFGKPSKDKLTTSNDPDKFSFDNVYRQNAKGMRFTPMFTELVEALNTVGTQVRICLLNGTLIGKPRFGLEMTLPGSAHEWKLLQLRNTCVTTNFGSFMKEVAVCFGLDHDNHSLLSGTLGKLVEVIEAFKRVKAEVKMGTTEFEADEYIAYIARSVCAPLDSSTSKIDAIDLLQKIHVERGVHGVTLHVPKVPSP